MTATAAGRGYEAGGPARLDRRQVVVVLVGAHRYLAGPRNAGRPALTRQELDMLESTGAEIVEVPSG